MVEYSRAVSCLQSCQNLFGNSLDLLCCAAAGCVADGPGCLLLDVKLSRLRPTQRGFSA